MSGHDVQTSCSFSGGDVRNSPALRHDESVQSGADDDAAVAPRATSPRSRRKVEITARLLSAASDLLNDGADFSELTIERLCAKAAVSRSTFYVYFEDRASLIRALIAATSSDSRAPFEALWTMQPPFTKHDLADRLAQVVHHYRPMAHLMAATSRAAAVDPLAAPAVERLMNANIAGMQRHVAAGQEQGFIDRAIDPVDAATWLTWMSIQVFHERLPGADQAEVDRITAMTAEILWRVLYLPLSPDGTSVANPADA
jgi:AcrR family transcriptional regulator